MKSAITNDERRTEISGPMYSSKHGLSRIVQPTLIFMSARDVSAGSQNTFTLNELITNQIVIIKNLVTKFTNKKKV